VTATKSGEVEFPTNPCNDQGPLDAIYQALVATRWPANSRMNSVTLLNGYAALMAREREVMGLVMSRAQRADRIRPRTGPHHANIHRREATAENAGPRRSRNWSECGHARSPFRPEIILERIRRRREV
jgi:hypothetical protein